ncbi:MAG: His/Gly/Thr/Pro-type tRNA ligase C-terminal domain-containing protein, partial [Terriglobales bacterium]
KIPYMLVIGKREAESGGSAQMVSVRTYQEKDRGAMALDALIAEVAEKTRARQLDVAVKDYSALFRTEAAAPAEPTY